jgi:V-type H+-transporting ATPase subunit a
MEEPTLFEDNEFTAAFSEIVNTYGIPNYKEMNPSVFTCATFPFLFGFMFGDIMHGIMLTTGALICIINAEKWRNTSFAGFVFARYLLLLMGLSATFAGFCYNDMTSIPLKIFGESCYDIDFDAKTAVQKEGCVYPIGIDPVWYMSSNELGFANSLKMKMSVILGVAQMSMGVIIKGINATYFNRKLEFFFEFIPQIILLLALFGFMDLMIICKWLIDWQNFPGGAGNPPSIVSQMIDMMLKGGALTASPLMANQIAIMQYLLICAAVAVPVMLCVRPCYIGCNRKSKKPHSEGDFHKVENTPINTAINEGGPDDERTGGEVMPSAF